MIHIADSQTDKILGFIPEDEFWDDVHKKSLKDTLETFDFTTFADREYAEHLAKRNRIIIPDEDGRYIEFIIENTRKYRDTDGSLFIEVYSVSSYLELAKAKTIEPQTLSDQTPNMALGFALEGTGWVPGRIEGSGTRTFHIDQYTNPYSFTKTIATEYKLERNFRVEHDGNKITGRFLDLVERVGMWRGREVEFGKDLIGIERKEDFSNIVTALIGLGPEREDGTRLEVFVEDKDALARWGRNGQHLVEVYEPQSTDQDMTEERLRELTKNELEKRINSIVEYTADIADLEKVPGLEHEKIRFGDTLRIKDTQFNPPLYLEARVHTQERSIKKNGYKTVTLGDYIEYTEEEINAIWRQLRNEIRRRLDRMAIVTINSTAGNVFKNAQGETELTARTFVSGAERDEQGTLYDYQWMRFDKHGNHDTDFYAEGKTITVKASDIDEKATYRVLVAYELEVINTAEITISNVFDGEDGEPGPPGPKGEDGQGVENITIEYYLSDSDSTTTGGTWTETKPTYQPGKYLWIRQKITYKNPTAIEYTTPVLDDSWKAVEIADEAKQEAEEAKQTAQQAQTTADGKNSVFHSPTAPPTTGRKIGDVWFDTSRDNLMHRFNGIEWVEAKWGEQSIVANSITANHIKSLVGLNVNDQFIVDSNGNVKFGGELISQQEDELGEHSVHINNATITAESYFPFADVTNEAILRTGELTFISYDGKNKNNYIQGMTLHSQGIGFGFGGDYLDDAVIFAYEYEGKSHLSLGADVIDILNNTPLWTGAVYLLDSHTVTPSKKLSDCMTGWILRWQAYNVGEGVEQSNFQYTHIPKVTLQAGGRGHRVLLRRGGTLVTKYFYIYNDYIVGHEGNGQGDDRNLVLSGVFEY